MPGVDLPRRVQYDDWAASLGGATARKVCLFTFALTYYSQHLVRLQGSGQPGLLLDV